MKRKLKPITPRIGEVWLNPGLENATGLVWLVVNTTPEGHLVLVGAAEEASEAEHFILTPGGRNLPVRMKWDLNQNHTVESLNLWHNGCVLGRVQLRWTKEIWRSMRELSR